VLAVFYSGALDCTYLAGAAALVLLLAALNRWRVYRLSPYLVVGAMLWVCIHASGLHSTLAGALLAFFIPTRPPPNFKALMTQARLVVESETNSTEKGPRRGLSLRAIGALDEIRDRLESPAALLLRQIAPRSSYIVLPLFAFANAGVILNVHALSGFEPLMLAMICGLVIGKPVGILLGSALAVRLGWASKPPEYSWHQLAGAGVLAGIGFTMSLFIAAEALPDPADFMAAKIAIFGASLLAAVLGVAILWHAKRRALRELPHRPRQCLKVRPALLASSTREGAGIEEHC
jgi:NhaA family Na+:H+ antiporter